MDEVIEESTKVNWLDDEIKNLPQGSGDFEKLPTPVFADKKITAVEIDATKPFSKWEDKEKGKTKAIIPCNSLINGTVTKCNWWLNVKNPVYKDVIRKCRNAKDKSKVLMKILQTGTQDATRYTLIEEGQ